MELTLVGGLAVFSGHVIPERLAVWTEQLAYGAGESLRHQVLAFNMHLRVGFDFGTVSTLSTCPCPVQLFRQQGAYLSIQVYNRKDRCTILGKRSTSHENLLEANKILVVS